MMLFNLSLGAGSILYTLNNANPTTTIVTFCKIRFYLLQSSAMAYRWCLVMACIDRYALSSTNASLRNFAQASMARRVVAIVVPTSFIFPVHILIFFDIRSGICGVVYNIIASIYHSIFMIVLGVIIPASIMIGCALLIHHNLVLKRQRRQQNAIETSVERNKVHHSQRKRDQQVLMMLLIQAIVFAILTTPLLINNFYTAATVFVSNKSPDRLAIERFAAFLTEMTMLCYPTSSFYLHTLVSRTFRGDLVRVISSAPICSRFIRIHRIEPTINDASVKTARKNNFASKVMVQTLSVH